MIKLIELARELTEKLLNDESHKLSKEYFYMFSISKFVLLKEKIVKKDSQNHILYFNNIKNRKYIPILYELYDYISKNGRYQIKRTDIVSLEELNTDSQKLAKAVWILNKMRDSFAHGMYSFDFENEVIIINNDHSNETEPYCLQCTIPIELLNSLSFFINDLENEDKKKNTLQRYKEYLSQLANQYNINYEKYYNNPYIYNINKKYDNDYKIEKINKDIYYNNDNKINYNYYNIDNSTYNYNSTHSEQSYPKKNKAKPQYDKFEFEIPNSSVIRHYINEMELEELRQLINLVTKYKPKNKHEVELIYKILFEYKTIIERVYELQENEEFSKKTQHLIDEIYGILDIKKKSKKMDAIVSLYNYMVLSFSQIKNISDVDLSYVKTEGLYFEFDQNYSNTIKALNSLCEDFNNKIEPLLEKYSKHPNDSFRHSLMDTFAKFYTDVLKKYNDKNTMIITSIRNSVEHGNYIAIKGGYVGLYDQPKQNDNITRKFSCVSSPETLFKIATDINKKALKENYTLKDFFKELENVVDNETYKKIIHNLNELSKIIFGKELETDNTMEKMYYSALVTVLKNATTKR